MEYTDLANVVASAAILVGCLGLLRFGERRNIVYARLHLAGIVDVACIFLTVILGYPLIGLTYFMLTPLAAHAVANAHHKATEGGAKP